MKAFICVGISGSGKSTFANTLQHTDGDNSTWQIINRDETRWLLSGKRGYNGPNAYKFYSTIERDVTDYNERRIEECAADGVDIIISDTNLNSVFREKLIGKCKALGYDVQIEEFPISFQEACKRDKQRGIYAVGEDVLMKQWNDWCKYHQDKGEGMWEQQRSKS